MRYFAYLAIIVFLTSCAGTQNRSGYSRKMGFWGTTVSMTVNKLPNVPIPTSGTLNGTISWYGEDFEGNPTASGEIFDPSEMTAAHKTMPFGTKLKVTNIKTGQSVVVKVNDRGPFVGDRILDLSQGAAEKIGLQGIAPAKIEIIP